MKTNQKLLLGDLISYIIHLNEKDPAFDATLKISSKGITLTTYANIWGTKTSFANSEEDLRDMIVWIEDQFRRSLSQRTGKAWAYQEPKEEIRDLENDLKRGIK
jgi:hypothetical protein